MAKVAIKNYMEKTDYFGWIRISVYLWIRLADGRGGAGQGRRPDSCCWRGKRLNNVSALLVNSFGLATIGSFFSGLSQ